MGQLIRNNLKREILLRNHIFEVSHIQGSPGYEEG